MSTTGTMDETLAATAWPDVRGDEYRLDRDSGLHALVLAARRLNIPVEAAQLRHMHGKSMGNFDGDDILLGCHRLGLKARRVAVDFDGLADTLAILEDMVGGRFMVSEGADPADAARPLQVCDPLGMGVERITRNEAAGRFASRAILVSRGQPEATQAPAFGFAWFIEPLGRYLRRFGYVLAVSLILQLFALATPLLFQTVTDKVLVSRGLQSLDVLAIGLLVLAVFEPLMQYIRGAIFAHMAGCLSSELSAKLFRHLVHLPVSYFRARRAGDILSRIRELDRVRNFVTGSTLMLVIDLLFFVVFVGVMFAYSATLAGVVIGALVLYVLIWLAVSPLLRRRASLAAERQADAMAHLTEAVTGIETLKSLDVGARFARDWEERLAAQLKASFRVSTAGMLAGGMIGLVQKLASALILWFGVRLVIRGELTVGELLAFTMLSGHVTLPVLRLAQMWQEFQHAGVSLRRLSDILGVRTDTQPKAVASALSGISGGLEVRQATFRYREDGQEVLRRLTLSVKPGEWVGITGASGSGKSTLTRLIQRLYTPQSGQVLIDGLDLALADPVALRQRMGVVLQDNFLFAGSIRANIALGCPGAGEESIRRAARLAGAAAFIDALPQGYDTEVGERGGLLSGGQRQRIALARALAADPRIVILDEATSALDYETEAAILERLPMILDGRTALIIAHRLNALQFCDRILVMDRGEIVEEGSTAPAFSNKTSRNHLHKMSENY